MKFTVFICAAVWLAAGAAQAAHVHAPIIIVQRGGTIEEPDLSGQPAKLPLDVLPKAPDAVEGVLRPKQIIAVYSVRASEAIVLDADVEISGRLLPAHTALARVDTTETTGAPAVLWCDVRRRMVFSPLFSVDCLQDDGSGALRRTWTGHLMAWKDSLGVGSATEGKARLPQNVATPYHKAMPEERPGGHIGYAYCDGDGVSGPPRFTTAVTVGFDGGWIPGMPYTCKLGTWRSDADHATIEVDAIQLQVSHASSLTYKVVQGLSATHLDSAAAGRPFLAPTPVRMAEHQASSGGSPVLPQVKHVRVLEPTGPASFVVSGVAAPGADLLRVPVRHGITGVLINSVSYSGLFGGRTLAAGRPVYGVPMSNAADGKSGLVWCALDEARGITYSACFPHDGIAYRWVDVAGPFAQSFIWSASSIQASAPSVKITMEDIHVPMQLSYRFLEWKKNGEAEVAMVLTSSPTSKSEYRARYIPLPSQAVVLATLAGRLQLRRANDGVSAEVQVLEPSTVASQ